MRAKDAALLLGAMSAFIIAVGGFALQVITFLDGRARDAKLDQVHSLVNSQSETLNRAIAESAFAEGRKAGIHIEREDPHANPAPESGREKP